MNSDIHVIMQIFVMHKHVQPQDAQSDHKGEGTNKFLSFLKTSFHEIFFLQFALEDVNRLRYNMSIF